MTNNFDNALAIYRKRVNDAWAQKEYEDIYGKDEAYAVVDSYTMDTFYPQQTPIMTLMPNDTFSRWK